MSVMWRLSTFCLIRFLEPIHSMKRLAAGIQVCEASSVISSSNCHSATLSKPYTLNLWKMLGSATKMDQMFQGADAFNQPLSSFDTSEVTNVRVYSLSQTVQIRPYLTSTAFSPPCYQMGAMFLQAVAFNQPLRTFDTTKVGSVSVYLLWGQTTEWETISYFLFLLTILSDE